MKSWNLAARGLTGAAIALTALMAGSCDFGNPITVKNGTEVEGLTGTLVVAAGSPAVGAWVRVFPVAPAVLAKNTASATDATVMALDSMQATASGTFQFKDLADGTYNIAATLQQGDTSFSMFLRGVIVVGNTNLGVDTLQIAGSLTLQALSGSLAVGNALCVIEDSPWQAVSNDLGTCILTGLPPGTFQVTVTHPSYSMSISGDITVLSNLRVTAGQLELTATSSPVPAAPLLVSPASLDTVESVQPVMIWRRVANAASYHVQLSSDSLFTSMLLNDSGRVDTNRTAIALAAATRYYWRVRAKNTAGVSPWSARWSFRTPAPASSELFLVAHWSFDETSGPLALDMSGNSRNGVISGAANRVTGVLGSALEFNGGTHVEIADSLINVQGDFTFAAWIWQSSQSQEQPILEFARPNAYAGVHIWVNTPGDGIVTTGMVQANLRGNGQPSYVLTTAGGVAPAGRWNHVAVTYDAATRAGRIYVNGAQAATYTRPEGAVSLEGTLYLGLRPSNSLDARAGTRFIGRMDDVRLYSKPLTGAEITSLHDAAAVGSMSIAPIVASQDAGIIAAAPSQSGNGPHVSLNFGKIADFGVGTYDMNTVGRGLVRFNIPAGITSSDIFRAVIRVHSYKWIQKHVQNDSIRINLHKVLRDWKEGTGASPDGTPNSATVDGVTGGERMWGTQNASEDWNQRLVGLNDIDASSSVVAQAKRPRSHIGYWEFDVTSLVKAWADQPTTNFGVLLAGLIPTGDMQTEDYPAFYTREAAVADSLKPVLLLNGGVLSGGGNYPVTAPSLSAAPTLVSPPQWDNGVPNPPTLTWNAVTGATSYQVQMATDSLFNSLILHDSGVTGTMRTVNGLLYSTEYNWRVRARNALGTGPWSTTFRFMTITGGPGVLPTPIKILEPLQGAVNVPRQSLVSWTGGSGTLNLQVVQVALDSAFTQLVTNDTSKSNGYYTVNAGTGSATGRTMGTLAGGKTHFVRVILGNDAGVRVSETRRFTTASETAGSGALPTPINLAAPSQGATDVPREPMVRFDGGSGTIKLLVVQVALDSAFTQLVTNDSDKYGGSGAILNNDGTGGSYGRSMGTLAGGMTHFVRVIIGNDAGVRVSETRRFTTVNWIPLYSNTTNALNAVTWNGTTYVAVGNAGTVQTSTDGSGWTLRNSGTTNTFFAVASNGSLVVAVGDNGAIRTSSNNGTTWTARTSGVTNGLYAVSWNGNQFVAGGAGGTLLTSVDGINWAARTSGTTSGIYAVAWTGSSHVITGANGTIRTSPDGVAWTARTSGVTGTLYALSWTGNVLTAAGANGVILTSANGTTWTQQVSGVTSALYSLAWNGTRRVAVGANGIALTSSNGTVWSRDDFGVPEGMYSVTSNGSIFVAAGQAGRIMTMP